VQKTSAETIPFNARITPEQKDLIQRAASALGLTMTDFVFQAARERAIATIEQQSVLRLTLADVEKFQAAIENPPMPSAEVLAAFERAPRATLR
jgi:uncharacterized protein (DUF1778 family)